MSRHLRLFALADDAPPRLPPLLRALCALLRRFDRGRRPAGRAGARAARGPARG